MGINRACYLNGNGVYIRHYHYKPRPEQHFNRSMKPEAAIPKITQFFGEMPKKLFKRSEIDEILRRNKKSWNLTKSMDVEDFIGLLVGKTRLEEARLELASRKEKRYIWGELSPYVLALSIRPDSYLTHQTAMLLHSLTEQIPGKIYVNHEQLRKGDAGVKLDQSQIDKAFNRPTRMSKSRMLYRGQEICLINGMWTGHLGVETTIGPEGERLCRTNVERTLIDITVRPAYSGGVKEVLNAYRLAKGKVSITSLASMLRRLEYVYPYHQCVGFYLEKAGVYSDEEINLFRSFEMKYDFYLSHRMKSRTYSEKWKLYYPESL
jgi:predicted transcriptional regulator of viral defense system